MHDVGAKFVHGKTCAHFLEVRLESFTLGLLRALRCFALKYQSSESWFDSLVLFDDF